MRLKNIKLKIDEKIFFNSNIRFIHRSMKSTTRTSGY